MKDDYTEREAWWAVGWRTVLIVVLVLVLVAGIWFVSVGTSDIAGKGNQRRQINSAENRTFAQEQFRELYQDIQAYDEQIATTAQQADNTTDPAERDRLNAVVLGVTNQCIATRRQYDAEAAKVTKQRFRDDDLPDRIDTSDPHFDCKGEAA